MSNGDDTPTSHHARTSVVDERIKTLFRRQERLENDMISHSKKIESQCEGHRKDTVDLLVELRVLQSRVSIYAGVIATVAGSVSAVAVKLIAG